MALGEEGLEPTHLRIGQPEKVAHRSVSLHSLNHADGAGSMGPDPTSSPQVLLRIRMAHKGAIAAPLVQAAKATRVQALRPEPAVERLDEAFICWLGQGARRPA